MVCEQFVADLEKSRKNGDVRGWQEGRSYLRIIPIRFGYELGGCMMKRAVKRTISLLLAAAMMISVLPAGVQKPFAPSDDLRVRMCA